MVPSGGSSSDVPGLLGKLADAALGTPTAFASTAGAEASVLGGSGQSLLLRLAMRSIQLLIGDLARERAGGLAFDPEPFARSRERAGACSS